MDAWFDGLPDDFSGEFHCGAMISGSVVQINWLAELVLHGDDIARSVGVPWEISERDMLLWFLEAAEVAPAYVRADIDPATEICVALQIPRCAAICHPRARRGRRNAGASGRRPTRCRHEGAGIDDGRDDPQPHRPVHRSPTGPAHRRRTAAVEGDEASVLPGNGLTPVVSSPPEWQFRCGGGTAASTADRRTRRPVRRPRRFPCRAVLRRVLRCGRPRLPARGRR